MILYFDFIDWFVKPFGTVSRAALSNHVAPKNMGLYSKSCRRAVSLAAALSVPCCRHLPTHAVHARAAALRCKAPGFLPSWTAGGLFCFRLLIYINRTGSSNNTSISTIRRLPVRISIISRLQYKLGTKVL